MSGEMELFLHTPILTNAKSVIIDLKSIKTDKHITTRLCVTLTTPRFVRATQLKRYK